MKEIPGERVEYTLRDIEAKELTKLFLVFERSFRAHLDHKVKNWMRQLKPLLQSHPELAPYIDYLTNEEIPKIRNSPNFNRYQGDLEKACAATSQISSDYDVAIGIAKKGLWLSYILDLYGLPTRDCLVIRTEPRTRFTVPLDFMVKKDVEGKRILVIDNDVVSAGTLNAVARHFAAAKAEVIDALVIYPWTEISREFYNMVRPNFRGKPTIHGERNDKVVLDATCEINPPVRKVISLHDYSVSEGEFHGLYERLEDRIRRQ